MRRFALIPTSWPSNAAGRAWRIIAGAPELFTRHTLTSYAAIFLRQVTKLSGKSGEGVIVVAADDAGDEIDPPILVVAASGSFVPERGLPYRQNLLVGYADLLEPYGIDRTDDAALAQIRLAIGFAAAEAGV